MGQELLYNSSGYIISWTMDNGQGAMGDGQRVCVLYEDEAVYWRRLEDCCEFPKTVGCASRGDFDEYLEVVPGLLTRFFAREIVILGAESQDPGETYGSVLNSLRKIQLCA